MLKMQELSLSLPESLGLTRTSPLNTISHPRDNRALPQLGHYEYRMPVSAGRYDNPTPWSVYGTSLLSSKHIDACLTVCVPFYLAKSPSCSPVISIQAISPLAGSASFARTIQTNIVAIFLVAYAVDTARPAT